MSIAKWTMPLSCIGRREVAIARPKQTPRGRLPDSGLWSLEGSGLDPGSSLEGPVPDSGTLFSRENEVRDRFLRRNAVLTSQTPPKRGSGMVRMGLFRVPGGILMPF